MAANNPNAPIRPSGLIGLDSVFADLAQEVPGFGGLFFDSEGNPVVYLTDASQQGLARAAVRPLLTQERRTRPDGSTAPDQIRTEPALFDFLTLARWRDALRREVFLMEGVLSLDIDESINRVTIGVEGYEVASQVGQMVRSLGLPPIAINVEIENASIPTQSLQDKQRPVLGGFEINFVGAPGPCTFGVTTWWSGGYAFLTASHCSPNPGVVDAHTFYQNSISAGNEIGYEVADAGWVTGGTCPPYFRCRYADVNISRFYAGVTKDFGFLARTMSRDSIAGSIEVNPTRQRFYIRSQSLGPLAGEVVQKLGRTSGWTYGPVIDTCYEYSYGFDMYPCQNRVHGGIEGGDSGGPIFKMLGGNDVRFYGIEHSGNTIDEFFNFSDVNNIQMQYGSIYTTLLVAQIDGPLVVPDYSACTWYVNIPGGVPPYSYRWYKNGSLVSTSNSYELWNTGPDGGTFTILLDVTDARGVISSDLLEVTVDHIEGEGCEA